MAEVRAQREPVYTQYMYNIGSFNPAYVNTVAKPEIALLYRSQWLDMPGAPTTMRLGVNLPFSNEQHGMGLNAVNDELGPSTQTYVDLAYAYKVKLAQESWLSFGLHAGGAFLNVDFSKGTFENPGEPILGSETLEKFYPTLGAGLFLYGKDTWYLGASTPNLLTNGIYDDDVAQIVPDKLQMNFIGGYVFTLSDGLKFKPAFLLNYISGAPLTTNLSANFLIQDVLTAGASYRVDNAISGLVGFQISSSIFAGYSYDYNTNPIGDYNKGSHEVILKFYLGKSGDEDKGTGESRKSDKIDAKGKPKQIDTPRFF